MSYIQILGQAPQESNLRYILPGFCAEIPRGTQICNLCGRWSSNSSMRSHGPSPTPTRTMERGTLEASTIADTVGTSSSILNAKKSAFEAIEKDWEMLCSMLYMYIVYCIHLPACVLVCGELYQ